MTSRFDSLASNALTLDLQAVTPYGMPNLYANGTATWAEEMVVTGGTGTGWLYFEFANSDRTFPGSAIGYNCWSSFNGADANLQGLGCLIAPRMVPFTFGVPLEVSFSIRAFAFADGAPQGALNSLVHWSTWLTRYGAYASPDPSGTPIPGAEIHLTPEPAVWQLVIAGGLWLATRRRVGWASRSAAR